MSASARPTVTFTDSDDAVLSYLAERTSDTIGARVARADAVLLGSVDDVSVERHEVKRAEVEAMRPWLSGEAGPPAVRVVVAEIEVERWLVGGADAKTPVQVARSLPASPSAVPLLEVFEVEAGSWGLLLLRRVPDGTPYRRYLPAEAYELADDNGFEPSTAHAYGADGDRVAVDRSSTVEAMAAAVEWHVSLSDSRPQRIAKFIDDPNPWIRRHAVRALALERTAEARATLSQALDRETLPDQRDRLMIGLWLADSRPEARERLLETYRTVGTDAWLSSWGIEVQPSADVSARFRGPDPAYVQGD